MGSPPFGNGAPAKWQKELSQSDETRIKGPSGQNAGTERPAASLPAHKNAGFYSFGQKESSQSYEIRTLASGEGLAVKSRARSALICAQSAQKHTFLHFWAEGIIAE